VYRQRFNTRSCLAVLAGLVLACMLCASTAKGSSDPAIDLVSSAGIIKRGNEVVWSRNQDRALPPASLTKIMTALLTIRRSRLDEVAVISRSAAAETGSRLRLKKGEKMYVGFLLAAALLQSANDACHALADHVAGDETRFVDLMNKEAHDLGMKRTHFVNACGHDHPDHYSSAQDLALLTEAALKEPAFSDLVATVYLDITTLGGKRAFHLENKNELVGRYPGALGVKTGFTNKAGKCVIALVERDGVRVLLVILNAPNRWWDAVSALDAVFANTSGQQHTGHER
jgi:D-alanyl-D-alanine carboxypeptidase (penicillin-binding protein 5/6)